MKPIHTVYSLARCKSSAIENDLVDFECPVHFLSTCKTRHINIHKHTRHYLKARVKDLIKFKISCYDTWEISKAQDNCWCFSMKWVNLGGPFMTKSKDILQSSVSIISWYSSKVLPLEGMGCNSSCEWLILKSLKSLVYTYICILNFVDQWNFN